MDFDDALEVVAQVRSVKRKVRDADVGAEIPVPDVEGVKIAGKKCTVRIVVVVEE